MFQLLCLYLPEYTVALMHCGNKFRIYHQMPLVSCVLKMTFFGYRGCFWSYFPFSTSQAAHYTFHSFACLCFFLFYPTFVISTHFIHIKSSEILGVTDRKINEQTNEWKKSGLTFSVPLPQNAHSGIFLYGYSNCVNSPERQRLNHNISGL